MATERIAEWSSTLEFSSLPHSVVEATTQSFYNYIGCTIGGSNHPTPLLAQRALSSLFGHPTSTVLGHTIKVDASHATLLNGIASHVHDYDDTHLSTIIHPTGPVASALLAASEASPSPITGEQFLLALTAGIEVECKLGLSVWPNHYDVGWHITSTTGSIGAAIAVSKLFNLNADQTAHAVGIAATQVTGLREMFGSDTKSFHVGRAAQNGLLAAMLAKEGFTSSLEALEAKRGWCDVVSTHKSLDEQVESLGKVWEVEKNAFKPFPCGIVVHPIIDGCIQLREELGEQSLKVLKRVKCRVNPLVLELTGKKEPKDGLQAKFSVYHGAAIGLVLGKASPADYEDDVVQSTQVLRVRKLVEATADENVKADQAFVEVELEDGQVFKKHVEHALGSLERPMKRNELEKKFLDQVARVVGQEKAESWSRKTWQIVQWNNITEALSMTI